METTRTYELKDFFSSLPQVLHRPSGNRGRQGPPSQQEHPKELPVVEAGEQAQSMDKSKKEPSEYLREKTSRSFPKFILELVFSCRSERATAAAQN